MGKEIYSALIKDKLMIKLLLSSNFVVYHVTIYVLKLNLKSLKCHNSTLEFTG